MSGDLFEGSRLKMEWAKEKIKEIKREQHSYFSANLCDIVVESDPEYGDRIVKIKLTASIPDCVYRLVAEAVYHLRSALDLMTGALARANGHANTKDVSFPFAGNREAFERPDTQRKIRKLAPDVADMIRALEPYEDGNTRLYGLGPLANIDKHNTLMPISTVGRDLALRNMLIQNAYGIIWDGTRRLDKGIPILNLGPDGSFLAKNKSIEVTGHIAFGDVEVFGGEPIIPTLHEMTQIVDDIVKTFSLHYVEE